jgi:hypothetical protein
VTPPLPLGQPECLHNLSCTLLGGNRLDRLWYLHSSSGTVSPGVMPKVDAASQESACVQSWGWPMILIMPRSLYRYMPTGQPITAYLDKLSILN